MERKWQKGETIPEDPWIHERKMLIRGCGYAAYSASNLSILFADDVQLHVPFWGNIIFIVVDAF